MAGRIRLGLIGANVRSNWVPRSHLPALAGHPDVELTAVCTTRPETAEEARAKCGAKFAFHDYRAMVASAEIDAVAVVIRVPLHFDPTKAALDAGKHVFTEWPLGRTTAEAVELAALARAKGLRTAVGLQSRVAPPLVYMRELVATGYVGEVMACHVTVMREGVLERRSSRTWQRDVTLGANTLTIATGHTIDALRFVVGDFERLSCQASTQAKQWFETDTKRMVDVTSPDNVLVNGRLVGGAVASVHVAAIPFAGSGFRMEIYGREGTLVATGEDCPQLVDIALEGVRGGHALAPLPVPDRFYQVAARSMKAEPLNVAELYGAFARAIRSGTDTQPTFDTAVALHRFVDAMRESSDTGRAVGVVVV
jgi:predicted dehydrogenase